VPGPDLAPSINDGGDERIRVQIWRMIWMGQWLKTTKTQTHRPPNPTYATSHAIFIRRPYVITTATNWADFYAEFPFNIATITAQIAIRYDTMNYIYGRPKADE